MILNNIRESTDTGDGLDCIELVKSEPATAVAQLCGFEMIR